MTTSNRDQFILAVGQGREVTPTQDTIGQIYRQNLVRVMPNGLFQLTEDGEREYVRLMTREEAEVPDFDTPVRARVANRPARKVPMFIGTPVESPDETQMRRMIATTLGVDPSMFSLQEFVSVLCARHQALAAESRYYAEQLARTENCF